MSPSNQIIWQERPAELLREEIKALLAPLSDVGGLYSLIRESLMKCRLEFGGGMVQERPWPLLPLMVCEAISGHYEPAVPLAAAIQFFRAAAEVYDDIEDADRPDSLSTKYGLAAATNAATTLLILAERAITRLRSCAISDTSIVHILETVNSYYTTACIGQHLDLSSTTEAAISEDSYLRIAAMKSASHVECACCAGALLATSDQHLLDLFSTYGHHLGMAAQIANDIKGIITGTDILKRKITLPVVYALAQATGHALKQLRATFCGQVEPVPTPTPIRDLLFDIGAVHYATLKGEWYRQRALDTLGEADAAGANITKLKLFLE